MIACVPASLSSTIGERLREVIAVPSGGKKAMPKKAAKKAAKKAVKKQRKSGAYGA